MFINSRLLLNLEFLCTNMQHGKQAEGFRNLSQLNEDVLGQLVGLECCPSGLILCFG